ncbi:MAG: hypothetical protein CMP11_01530 [Zetaproteobacteria bacterium]|nr:hypothetical protein [Pseudobdellovibrionaceae bacterium]
MNIRRFIMRNFFLTLLVFFISFKTYATHQCTTDDHCKNDKYKHGSCTSNECVYTSKTINKLVLEKIIPNSDSEKISIRAFVIWKLDASAASGISEINTGNAKFLQRGTTNVQGGALTIQTSSQLEDAQDSPYTFTDFERTFDVIELDQIFQIAIYTDDASLKGYRLSGYLDDVLKVTSELISDVDEGDVLIFQQIAVIDQEPDFYGDDENLESNPYDLSKPHFKYATNAKHYSWEHIGCTDSGLESGDGAHKPQNFNPNATYDDGTCESYCGDNVVQASETCDMGELVLNEGSSCDAACQETVDCHGISGGDAFIDSCGECVGGLTGKDPCDKGCDISTGEGCTCEVINSETGATLEWGVLNCDEICITDPSQFDTSSCDADDDGVIDRLDNCPDKYNPDQKNTDHEKEEESGISGDNFGDVCDDDDDNDGCDDEIDDMPLSWDDDYDGDEVPDDCDLDDDNDGSLGLDELNDINDSNENNRYVCSDDDDDGCDDCTSGHYDPKNDGDDLDEDGLCDLGDPDIDGDGCSNHEDQFETVASSDTDGDGYADDCDDDDDGDGTDDSEELECQTSPSDAEESPFDIDGDGLCNLKDNDDDGDGIKDTEDNCPLTSNAGQNDTDDDGVGDACVDDYDGDEILNEDDNCPLVSNPHQKDVDSDGEGDKCDEDMDNDECLNSDDKHPKHKSSDLDEDGYADDCDPDIDGDGVLNDDDNDIRDRFVCSDIDLDLCDDCSSGSYNLTNDGEDFDGDNFCDFGDHDDDNDHILDRNDDCLTADNHLSADYDSDGCDDFDEDKDDDNDGISDHDDFCDPDRNNGKHDLDLGEDQSKKDWTSNERNDVDRDGCYDRTEDDNKDNDCAPDHGEDGIKGREDDDLDPFDASVGPLHDYDCDGYLHGEGSGFDCDDTVPFDGTNPTAGERPRFDADCDDNLQTLCGEISDHRKVGPEGVEITCDTHILEGGVLTIAPGTKVNVHGGAGLIVHRGAKIFADGTIDKPITFDLIQEDLKPKSHEEGHGEEDDKKLDFWKGIKINGRAPVSHHHGDDHKHEHIHDHTGQFTYTHDHGVEGLHRHISDPSHSDDNTEHVHSHEHGEYNAFHKHTKHDHSNLVDEEPDHDHDESNGHKHLLADHKHPDHEHSGLGHIHEILDYGPQNGHLDSGKHSNSGSLSFVRIYGAGSNKTSALDLRAVGHGTHIVNVEIGKTNGPGLSLYGGNVDFRNISLLDIGGDSLSFFDGYQGRGQQIFIKRDDKPGLCIRSNSFGDEELRTHPHLSNVTCLMGENSHESEMIRFEGNSAGDLRNIVLHKDGDKIHRAIFVEHHDHPVHHHQEVHGSKESDYPHYLHISSNLLAHGVKEGHHFEKPSEKENKEGEEDDLSVDEEEKCHKKHHDPSLTNWIPAADHDKTEDSCPEEDKEIKEEDSLDDDMKSKHHVYKDGNVGHGSGEHFHVLPDLRGPAYTHVDPVKHDGFFRQRNYTGAFGTLNWLAGWSHLYPEKADAQSDHEHGHGHGHGNHHDETKDSKKHDVSILHVISTINLILDKEHVPPFEFKADANDDGFLNIFDVLTAIRIILGHES